MNGFDLVGGPVSLEKIDKEWPKQGEKEELRVVPHGIALNTLLLGMSLPILLGGAGGITLAPKRTPTKKV